MLTVSLFSGSNKLQDHLVNNVPQDHGQRFLLMLAVIHEVDTFASPDRPKIMLYQEALDPSRFWIRKESGVEASGKTSYTEFECEDAITALGGFEKATQLMLDDECNKIDIALLDEPAVPIIEKGIHSEASARRRLS
jgi:hypothetical protein